VRTCGRAGGSSTTSRPSSRCRAGSRSGPRRSSRPTQLDGTPWLAVIGELFAEAALSPRSALVYADRLPFGAIVLRGDLYLLRSGVALPTLTLAALDWHLAIVVREAVRLRANLLGPQSSDAARAFDYHAE
jgi:hypothetical protein